MGDISVFADFLGIALYLKLRCEFCGIIVPQGGVGVQQQMAQFMQGGNEQISAQIGNVLSIGSMLSAGLLTLPVKNNLLHIHDAHLTGIPHTALGSVFRQNRSIAARMKTGDLYVICLVPYKPKSIEGQKRIVIHVGPQIIRQRIDVRLQQGRNLRGDVGSVLQILPGKMLREVNGKIRGIVQVIGYQISLRNFKNINKGQAFQPAQNFLTGYRFFLRMAFPLFYFFFFWVCLEDFDGSARSSL